jgi:hypothetical protein
MKITIDTNVIKSKGLTLYDFFILYSTKELAKTSKNIQDSINFLKDNGLVLSDKIASQQGIKLIDEILNESSVDIQRDYESLADNLQALWPSGNKDGKYRWKSNKTDVIKKLEKFFRVYGNSYTNEQVVSAAKKYVASFDATGDRKYQKVLKYFIFKEDGKGSLLADNLEAVINDEEDENNSSYGETLF